MRKLVAFLFWIAACGGNQEAKQPQPDQTAQSDAAATATTSESAMDAGAPATQTDAQAAAAPDAAPSDDVDKSVAVCGDETMPIEKKVRKKVKECWSDAASRDPSIDGHVSIRFVVDAHGKVTKTDLKQKKTLPAATSACILAAINAYKLDGTKCPSKTVGFEEAFGRAAAH
ncbi:MAG TPA: hypothetical protein VGH28_30350 [Polyangiaceae bacterium]|jgi:hypothetical protein